MSDDAFIQRLREHLGKPAGQFTEYETPTIRQPASEGDVACAEARLGMKLTPLLRRIFTEVADGGFGPGYGLFSAGGPSPAGRPETLVHVYEKLSSDSEWPEFLLPINDWGCANWSCLDCRDDEGPIVMLAGDLGLFEMPYTLRSWLEAWINGVDLWNEMYEPGPAMIGTNPFTKKPMQIAGSGKPRGIKRIH